MANDKDFVVNGPVAVGKDTKVTVGSISAGTVDLSTGNYFTDTPTGDYTYTFANPGDVQAFQIEATGGSAAVASTFSTTLYTGNGTTQTIDNGLDLSGDGGLVWLKWRSGAVGSGAHVLVDTERGINYWLSSSTTSAQNTTQNSVTAFNSNGFSIVDAGGKTNYSGDNYVSWSFKKQTKFFDIVTYTGDGVAGREIAHNLGSVPGMVMVKRTDASTIWPVYHTGVNGGTNSENYILYINGTASQIDNNTYWNDTAPTDSVFTIGTNTNVNASGGTYVAYLFAHDTASDGLIQCGSYTGNGSTTGPEINLGWQPQWLLVKNASASANWVLLDTVRGMPSAGSNQHTLLADSTAAELVNTAYQVQPLAGGFQPVSTNGLVNASGNNYIYMAIRSASAPAITWPTNIEWPAGITPSTPAEGETDVYTFTTDDGGTTYTGIQSIDNAS